MDRSVDGFLDGGGGGGGGGMVDVKVVEAVVAKKKRGRPPRVQAKAPAPAPAVKRQKKEKEDEDVCFICFDGGSLVLCDRRDCPKAYHPACIRRDEAFFRQKCIWNCGWHICSICVKASHYFCYTCTYSLCKGCIKASDMLCVRGNKGFCATCLRTIMLLENSEQGIKDAVQVDFDDKTSWEYLFKVYWMYLKGKLSLTLDEITRAKNRCHITGTIAHKREPSDESNVAAIIAHKREPSAEPNRVVVVADKREPSVEPNGAGIIADKREPSVESNVVVIIADKREPSVESNVAGIIADKREPSDDPNVAGIIADKSEPSDEPNTTGITAKERESSYKPNMDGITAKEHEQSPEPNIAEITAKKSKPSHEPNMAGITANKCDSSHEPDDANDDKCSSSDSPSELPELSASKTNKAKRPAKSLVTECLREEKSVGEGKEWASKELLEFVSHMKNGDTSVLSQFDVQALMLEYIKRNNLRDPQKKCQIICDSRLENLFGRPRVGHFEMLKLLEYHFLIIEDSQADNIAAQGLVVDAAVNKVEVDVNNVNDYQAIGKDKRRKTRKKGDDRGPPQINLNSYAAIDLHNINLIYLRRNLMENLIDDIEKFHEKVVGCVVRIRISSGDQKQDMYRLVQVVGTSKADEKYRIGKRTTDFVLEILNLDKKEVISIDAISNQEFSEDECRRFHQSIRCGLINRLTVGEIQEKAMAFQALRVNDWLETEILRLTHLRDRASEKGHRKDLRECVEKLQLLNSPEERQRKLKEIPDVHADSKMDHIFDYESEEDAWESEDQKQGSHVKPKPLVSGSKVRKPASQIRSDIPKVTMTHPRKDLVTNCEQSRDVSTSVTSICSANEANRHLKPRTQVDPTGAESANEPVVSVATEPAAPAASVSETDIMWHYQDPTGKIQGPFSMLQLRKWDANGFFPPDLRVWRINEKQDDSILLTDALNGNFQKEPPLQENSCSQPHEASVASENRETNLDNGSHVATADSNGKNELVRSDGWGSTSSSWTTNADAGQLEPLHDPIPTVSVAEKSDSDQNNGNCDSHSNEKLPSDSPDEWNANHDVVSMLNNDIFSVMKQLETPEQNIEVDDFPDLPSPTPKQSGNDDWNAPDPEIKLSLSSNVPLQESAISWSSEDWDSSLVSASPLKLTEVASGNAATPTSEGNATTTSIWQLIATGLDETGSLPNESVSDLLNKVDAIESLIGLASSTSVGGDLTAEGYKANCFCSVDGLSPTPDLTPDPDKSDVLSSTGDLPIIHSELVMKDETRVISQADASDPQKRSSGNSSSSSEVKGEPKQSDVSVVHWDTGINIDSGISLGLNHGIWGSPVRHNGYAHALSGQRDRVFQGGNRQSSFVGGGGGGLSRPPQKGKRVCKFFESGHCRKGALCDYLHP